MRYGFLLLLLLSAAGLVSGCTNDGSSLFIVDVKMLDEECVVSNVSLLEGVVDVSLADSLTLFPTFASQVRDRVSAISANPNDMHVYAVDIEIRAAGGGAIDLGGGTRFRVATAVFIEGYSGSGEFPTNTGAVQVLPPGYPQTLQSMVGDTTVYIAMRPIGRTNGGTEVEGNFDYVYPVSVCNGCLVRCAIGDEMETVPCTPGQNEELVQVCAP